MGDLARVATTAPRPLLFFALAIHLATAWFSSGYYAADEHYQVITFAEVKAGHEPPTALPWEHAARIRCTLLPATALAAFTAADAAGVRDPFHKAFLLRVFTAMAALLIVLRWTRSAGALLPSRSRTAFLLVTWTLWFLPFQHVRFTGETWSGLLLLAAATELMGDRPGRHAVLRAGLWLGIAAMVRPPVVVAAAGLVAWALRTGRLRGPGAAFLPGGCAIAVAAITLLDSWWYGAPVSTWWNYAAMGVGGRPGGDFEVMPWWAYGAYVIKDMLVPIGLLALGAFAVLWVKRPAGPLLWMVTPFLLFHLLVPHKEMRFLFPLADLVPLLLVQGWAALGPLNGAARMLRWAALGVAAAFNVAGLAVASFSPAGSGRTRLAQQLGPAIGEVVYDADKITVWKIAVPPFYGGPAPPGERLRGPCDAGPDVVVSQRSTPCNHAALERIATADPAWADALLTAYRWRKQERGWAAYRAMR